MPKRVKTLKTPSFTEPYQQSMSSVLMINSH